MSQFHQLSHSPVSATPSISDLVSYTLGAATTEASEVDPSSETENDVDVCTTFIRKLVDVLRLTENHVVPCSQLSITCTTVTGLGVAGIHHDHFTGS